MGSMPVMPAKPTGFWASFKSACAKYGKVRTGKWKWWTRLCSELDISPSSFIWVWPISGMSPTESFFLFNYLVSSCSFISPRLFVQTIGKAKAHVWLKSHSLYNSWSPSSRSVHPLVDIRILRVPSGLSKKSSSPIAKQCCWVAGTWSLYKEKKDFPSWKHSISSSLDMNVCENALQNVVEVILLKVTIAGNVIQF